MHNFLNLVLSSSLNLFSYDKPNDLLDDNLNEYS